MSKGDATERGLPKLHSISKRHSMLAKKSLVVGAMLLAFGLVTLYKGFRRTQDPVLNINLGITLETTVLARPPAVKNWRLVVLLDQKCKREKSWIAMELECMKTVLKKCHAFSESSCFLKAITNDSKYCSKVFLRQSCHANGDCSSYKLWYQTVWNRVLPHMERMGWTDLHVESDVEQVSDADVIIMSGKMAAHNLPLITELNPGAQLILMDTSASSVLSTSLSWGTAAQLVKSPQVAMILKHTVAEPATLQNGPLLGDAAHLAMVPGAEGRRKRRHWSNDTLGKIVPLMPMSFAYRYPWACGGRPDYIRFGGFFWPELKKTFVVKSLRERTVDVAVWTDPDLRDAALVRHRDMALAAGNDFKSQHPQFRVFTAQRSDHSYHKYLAMLANTKIVVSTWGAGEWSALDFEAVMMGCLVVKPGAAGARLYPSVFEVGKTVVDVDPGFTELAPTLRGALTNLGRAQAMVDRAAEVWRESVNLTRVAEDISGAMITALLRADAATSAEQGSFLNQQ